jgi:hypothetical protein
VNLQQYIVYVKQLLLAGHLLARPGLPVLELLPDGRAVTCRFAGCERRICA